MRHALKNAFPPVLSYLGPAIALAVTGRFVVKRVFAVLGIGQNFVRAVLAKNMTLLLGVVLVFGALVDELNLLADLLCAWVDTRIHAES